MLWCSCGAYVPEDGGAVENAGDGFAIGGRLLVQADRNIGDFLERDRLDLAADALLLRELGRGQPLAAQGPHLLARIPAGDLAFAADVGVAGRVEPVDALPIADRGAPAALPDRILLELALQDDGEIEPGIFDVHAGLAQAIDSDLAQRLLRQRIGGHEHHDLLAIVAGGLQLGLDLVVVARAAEHVEADVARHRRAGREEADRRDLKRRVGAGNRRHEGGLIDRAEQRAADGGIVERRLQMIEAQHAGVAAGIEDARLDVAGGLDDRQQIVRRGLLPVLLAGLERGDAGAGIWRGGPDHAVVVNDLRSRGPIRLAVGAGLVALEFRIGVAGALHALVGEIAERTAADDFGQRLERVLARQPLRHHEAGIDRGLAERLRQQRERPLEAEADGAVVRRRELRRSPPSARRQSRRARPSGGCWRRSRGQAHARRRARTGHRASVRSHWSLSPEIAWPDSICGETWSEELMP